MSTIAVQVNDNTIANGEIEDLVGSENYQYVSPGHVKVFDKDAMTPQTVYYDGVILEISIPDFIKDMTYETNE